MPGLDVYFAADPYEEKARTLRNSLYRMSGRYRHFAVRARRVCAGEPDRDPDDPAAAAAVFREALRDAGAPFPSVAAGHLAGPTRAPANAAEVRAGFRAEFGLAVTARSFA